MSIPNQPGGTTKIDVGGSLYVPTQPSVITFALRFDQYQTLCEGESNVSRSIRDMCIGVFATGATAILGLLPTMDWALAEKQGRHPMAVTILLCSLTLGSLAVGIIEWMQMWQTQKQSSYSRLVQTIADYFEGAKTEQGQQPMAKLSSLKGK
jgi:hypothetical protein